MSNSVPPTPVTPTGTLSAAPSGGEGRGEVANPPHHQNIVDLSPILARPRLVPLVRPSNPEEANAQSALLQTAHRRALEDEHVMLSPTHLFMAGEQPIGYVSLGTLPCVHAWFDTRHRHPLDSLRMIETSEAILATQGHRAITVPVSTSSPFSKHMERLGYRCLGTTQLWIKHL